jgi:broad specificity phosphatase PhoE
MNQLKNIITIQHPESMHHTNGMVGSWTDWELSEKGKQQANAIARNLKNEIGSKQFVLYSSPLLRTVQTAEIVAKQLNIVPQLVGALKERGLGRANGQSVKWLKENIEQQELTVYDRCFSDAESRSDVWNRLLPFYNEIVNDDIENFILVSHGDTLSILNAIWLRLEMEVLNTIDLYGVSGGVSFLQQNKQGKRIIRKLGDTSYMK